MEHPNQFELLTIVSNWPHERDRLIYVHPDGREEVLYDTGCDPKWCRRCQIEKYVKSKMWNPTWKAGL